MRKCVFFFLLLVFVLIVASISENKEAATAQKKVAMQDVSQESTSQSDALLKNELPR